jgi:predicted nuclease of predicted toxin-antitoxin system
MSIPLYMDEHFPHVITVMLRERGVDVLTAQEDGTRGIPDPDLLDCATELGRALVTSDHDFEAEAARRQSAGIWFAGVVYIRINAVRFVRCADELELISIVGEPADLANLLRYVPL